MNGNPASIEVTTTNDMVERIEPGQSGGASRMGQQENQSQTFGLISSGLQSHMTGEDGAVAVDDVEAPVSTSRLPNRSKAHASTYPFADLPLTAAGKFTVSSAEMIELLSLRTDNEIDAIVKQADSAELQGFQLSLYARCWVGGCCWERRRRNSEMKKKHFKTIPLETWCQSVGLRSPKSAKRWADNFQTVLDTSAPSNTLWPSPALICFCLA